ncbi:hypothetical protein HAP94_07985 [Acidithiobacillus ferrivorans]|nr:hypothetical protein [Acidithiobacillus ferrivorans]
MTTKRDDALATIADEEVRELMRRFSDEIGMSQDDDRWEFLKALMQVPENERDSVYETIGRMVYDMDDVAIEEWKRRIENRSAPILDTIKTDMAFERFEKYAAVQSSYMQQTGKTAKDVALEGLTQESRERVIGEAASVGIVAEYDVGWFLIGAQIRCWSAVAATGSAVHEFSVRADQLPGIMQKAAIGAAKEVAGQIDQALSSKIPDFANAIKLGVMKGTEGAITSIDSASKKLADAAGKFDSDVDKTVIARRDAVLAQWVQSGSDALEKRMAAAVHKERIFNVYLIMFLAGASFATGIVLGMHLHF